MTPSARYTLCTYEAAPQRSPNALHSRVYCGPHLLAASPRRNGEHANRRPCRRHLNLWSTVLASIELLAQQLATSLFPDHIATSQDAKKPPTPQQHPPALAASAAYGAQSLSGSATSTESDTGNSTATQSPQLEQPWKSNIVLRNDFPICQVSSINQTASHQSAVLDQTAATPQPTPHSTRALS